MLKAPILGTIPNQSGLEISIPFTLPEEVDIEQVDAMRLEIAGKSYNSEKIIDKSQGEYVAIFSISSNVLRVGAQYSIRVACIDDSGVRGSWASSTLGHLGGKLIAFNDLARGCISVQFEPVSGVSLEGGFYLKNNVNNTRSYINLDKIISTFSSNGDREYLETKHSFDYYNFIEPGLTYSFELQNASVDTPCVITSNEVVAEMNDIFLSDKYSGSQTQRQLRICFDPKVSVKINILESKQDTLGSKYPFILRCGETNYKEYTISGLISYWMDEGNTFKRDSYVSVPSTQLEASNVRMERKFRDDVLEWLTDGAPKLMRSATEGNHIVRLMNIQLTPNQTLGRMLYSFSCTAYEIADYNQENLIKYGLEIVSF